MKNIYTIFFCFSINALMLSQIQPGRYIIKTATTYKALDANRTQMAQNGGSVQIWDACANYQRNCEPQIWEVVEASDGFYTITLENTNKRLEAKQDEMATNNGRVQLMMNTDAPCQKWRIRSVGSNRYTLINYSGKALDIDRAQLNINGGLVHLWDPCPDPANNCEPQLFTFFALPSLNTLEVRLGTGADDLAPRGFQENLEIKIVINNHPAIIVTNANRGQIWGNGSIKTVRIPLPMSIRQEDIREIILSRNPIGSLDNFKDAVADNWILQSIKVTSFIKVNGTVQTNVHLDLLGRPIYRFVYEPRGTQTREGYVYRSLLVH